MFHVGPGCGNNLKKERAEFFSSIVLFQTIKCLQNFSFQQLKTLKLKDRWNTNEGLRTWKRKVILALEDSRRHKMRAQVFGGRYVIVQMCPDQSLTLIPA